jgi:hypothetical protein
VVSSICSTKRRGKPVADTVISQFRTQVRSLLTGLEQTKSHHILCIKPNSRNDCSSLMENNTTLEQLKYASIVAAITISRSIGNNRSKKSAAKRIQALARAYIHRKKVPCRPSYREGRNGVGKSTTRRQRTNFQTVRICTIEILWILGSIIWNTRTLA